MEIDSEEPLKRPQAEKTNPTPDFWQKWYPASLTPAPLRVRALVSLINGTMLSLAFPLYASIVLSHEGRWFEIWGSVLLLAILWGVSLFMAIWGFKTLRKLDSEE